MSGFFGYFAERVAAPDPAQKVPGVSRFRGRAGEPDVRRLWFFRVHFTSASPQPYKTHIDGSSDRRRGQGADRIGSQAVQTIVGAARPFFERRKNPLPPSTNRLRIESWTSDTSRPSSNESQIIGEGPCLPQNCSRPLNDNGGCLNARAVGPSGIFLSMNAHVTPWRWRSATPMEWRRMRNWQQQEKERLQYIQARQRCSAG